MTNLNLRLVELQYMLCTEQSNVLVNAIDT